MFFKEDNKEKDLIKVCALLIHTAKIDEHYSSKEEEIIKKTLLTIGAKSEELSKIIKEAKKLKMTLTKY